MKILIDKPAPVPTNQSSTSQNIDGLLDLLTSSDFSNTLNDMQDYQVTNGEDQSSYAAEPLENNIENRQIDALIAEIMQMSLGIKYEDKLSGGSLNQSELTDLPENVRNIEAETDKSEMKITQDINDSLSEMIVNVTQNNRLEKTNSVERDGKEEIDILSENKFNIEAQQEKTKKLTTSVKFPEDDIKSNDMKDLTQAQFQSSEQNKSVILRQSIEKWVTHINRQQPVITTENVLYWQQLPNTELKNQTIGLTMADESITSKSARPINLKLESVVQESNGHDSYQIVLKVSPPELGPVHAMLKMTKNKLEIKIMTTNSHAEQIIKAHISVLGEQFDKNQLYLHKIDVQQQSFSSLNQENYRDDQSRYIYKSGEEDQLKLLKPTTQRNDKSSLKSESLIDEYI